MNPLFRTIRLGRFAARSWQVARESSSSTASTTPSSSSSSSPSSSSQTSTSSRTFGRLDVTGIPAGATRVSDREGGRYYERQWQSAMDMRADWVVITSWNEWFENTQIEPSARYGDRYVTLTKEWAERFRRSRAVPR